MAAAGNPYDCFRKVLECSICLDVYEDPKTLKCAHDYCKCCLEDILTFQKDGTVAITCPMRCAEKTLLTNQETVEDLGTSYTIKGMLDTLRTNDTSREKAVNNPICQGKTCVNQTTVFCCGSILCKSCHDKHMEIMGCKAIHDNRNLVFNTRENKLRVLCDQHSSGCTHLCDVDNQFLCIYCLHRDHQHQNHTKNTIEAEAQLLKEALNHKICHAREVEENVQKRINDAKDNLKIILKQRKRQCLLKYETRLDQEMTRLIGQFEKSSGDFGNLRLVEFYEDILERLDVEMVLRKKEILTVLGQKSYTESFKCLELLLTELDFDNVNKPLGDLNAVVYHTPDFSRELFRCNWTIEKNEIHSVLPSETMRDGQCPDLLSSSERDDDAFADDETCTHTEASCQSDKLNHAEDSLFTYPAKLTQGDCFKPPDDVPSALCGFEGVPSSDEPAVGARSVSFTAEVKPSCITPGGPIATHVAANAAASKPSPTVETSAHKPTEDTSPRHSACISKSAEPFDEVLAEDMKQRGNKFFKQEHYQKAIECYDEAIKICPSEFISKLAVFHQNRGAANEQLSRWSAVVVDCSTAIKLNPKYCKALIRRARAYERLGEKRKAVEDLVFVREIRRSCGLQMEPDWDLSLERVHKSLSNDLAKNHCKTQAVIWPRAYQVEDFFQMFSYDVLTVHTTSSRCDANYSEILEYMKKAEYGTVMKLCDLEIETGGKHIGRALLLRGSIKYLINDSSCMDDFCEVTKLPLDKDNLLLHVDAQLKISNRKCIAEEDIPGCLAAIHLARKLDPNNATTYATEGVVLMQMGKLEESKKCLETAVSLDSTLVLARVHIATVISLQGREHQDASLWKKAEEMFIETTEKYPNCCRAWRLYASCLLGEGRHEEAFEKFDKAILSNPSSPTALVEKALYLIDYYFELEEAEKLLLAATEIDKQCGLAYLNLAKIQMRKKRYEMAVKYSEQGIQNTSGNELWDCFQMLEFAKAYVKFSRSSDSQTG